MSASRLARLPLIALSVTLAGSAGAQIAYPQLNSIFPPGGRAGETVEVSIGGSDLEEANGLVFSHPGIVCEQIAIPATEFLPERQEPLRYRVSISRDVPVGSYEVCAKTRLGLTAPRAFAVGSLPEVAQTSNTTRENAMSLPVDTIVNGTADSEAIDYYSLALEHGEQVLVRCRAESIDSRMDATLVIEDNNGRELMRDRDTLGRDAVLDFTAPATGIYTILVFDFTYRGGSEYPYRLSASRSPHIDFIYPSAGEPGTTSTFKLYGRNLPGGSKGEGIRLGHHELETVEVQIALDGSKDDSFAVRPVHTSLLAGMDYRLKSEGAFSNPVRIGFAQAPVVAGKEHEGEQQVTAPCEIHARFDTRNDLDSYRFEAKKGAPLWIEVIAERMGSGSDPIVFLEKVTVDSQGNEQAQEVASNDDAGSGAGGRSFNLQTRDPAIRFSPPEDGAYRINVFNQTGDGGPEAIYRLVVQDVRPGFELVAVPWLADSPDKQVHRVPTLLRQGGTAAMRVFALRRDGFRKPIKLAVSGLPDGIQCPPVTIGENKESATLIFGCAEDAPEWHGFVTITGEAGDLKQEARAGTLSWMVSNFDQERVKPRLSTQLPVSVYDGEKAPLVVETPAQRLEVTLGEKLEIPIKLTKNTGVKGDFVVQPIGLPYAKDAPSLKLKENDTEGKLTLSFNKSNEFPIEPGEWQFALLASGTVKYRNNVAAVERTEQERKRLEELEKRLQEEAKHAQAAVEPARAAVQEAEKNLQAASDDAKPDLEGAVAKKKVALEATETRAKESAGKAQRAATAKAQAAERAKQSAERAKEREVKHGAYSMPITVVVNAPAPKAEDK